LENAKEAWQNLPKKKKKALISIVAITFAVAAAIIIFLNLSHKTSYSPLFTGLSQDEAKQVVGLLQEKQVKYTYDASDGSISVPDADVEKTRVELLSQGYPKSGFAYNMYISNTGLMTTESDKKQYTLYDLQDRLGATIRLFDGVQDAKVTIANGSDSTFALDSGDNVEASASAVVTMKPGSALSEKNAEAIKNLISRSVKGINFTNVSVFDAATMEEIGGQSGDSSQAAGTLESEAESKVEANIRKVLGKLYGAENIAVSVKGTLDMTKIVQENTQYNVPEKINDQDKTGLISHEETNSEKMGSKDGGTGGVVGTDANADTPRYTTETGETTESGDYANSSASRDWLYNVLKEQREISPGALKDASVAIVISTADQSVQEDTLINLVADAAGIDRDAAANKITIVRSENTSQVEAIDTQSENQGADLSKFPIKAFIIMIISFVLLLLFVIAAVIFRIRSKKQEKLEEEELKKEEQLRAEREAKAKKAKEEEELDIGGQDSEAETQTDASMRHGMRLKRQIGDFVDQNPQAAAKLLQSWLHEEETKNGRNSRK
jgi:flagellar M-ring protein FliF